ncbi:arabinosyltransferase domain-containing protein [Mycobacterium tuberculosis]|uniref:arabinosyltransferase domain-containing protein n=1 Tax=Mycobacterium tuberculosis TaxID=1773 RepID=UPI0032B35585
MRHRRRFPARALVVDRRSGHLVIAVLVWWHFVGANTSDDGCLRPARVSEHAGYMAQLPLVPAHRAPFGWYCDLLALCWLAPRLTYAGCAYPPWRWRSPA